MMKNFLNGELKNASLSQLNAVCEQLRREILQTVSVCGGHLASNLGVVELTVALHRVFDFSVDKLIFDVGHQCYPHKLLTDRAERFGTLRQKGGISGFPKRGESIYDCYETGHAGTAVSAALGLAKARDLSRQIFHVVALVGDGAFQNGLVYEALNSLRTLDARILIVLNDNGMSISPTTGGMHDILDELKGSRSASDVALFERFGLQYMGIYNGNDLNDLLPAVNEAKRRLKQGSVLLHVVTKKGQGYAFSECAPDLTHGISPQTPKAEYATALGEELCALARENDKVVAVTAAMTDALGLRPFFREFPQRAFDVGICEEHAAVLSAALAAGGMKPYFAIYSTFLQRAFDEVIHDICGQRLSVTLCVDRAGATGADGETHQGIFDLSYLSFIPGLVVAIPKNIAEFRAMLRVAARYNGPIAIRYPREGEEGVCTAVEIGKFEVLHCNTSNIIIFAAGERCIRLAQRVRLTAADEGIGLTLVNARFLKPLDEEFLRSRSEQYVITLEDNAVKGGLGDAIAGFYRNSGKCVYSFGYREAFLPHATVTELADEYGLNAANILNCVKSCHAGR